MTDLFSVHIPTSTDDSGLIAHNSARRSHNPSCGPEDTLVLTAALTSGWNTLSASFPDKSIVPWLLGHSSVGGKALGAHKIVSLSEGTFALDSSQ